MNETISIPKYNRICLHYPHGYAILVTSQREETKPSGDNDGKISDRKRDCRDLESVRRHYHQTLTAEETSRVQSRELLEGKRVRPSRVLGQTEEYSGQKIKPVWWLATIENLMAFRLPLRVLANARDNPRNSLSFFSIALDLKKVKAVHRRAG